jgi:glucuronate isomerase
MTAAARPFVDASDRYFSSDPACRRLARELYASVAELPLVCPHGHVDPRLFADPSCRFGSPAELLIIPDHYLLRMLYSQGIRLERLGVPPLGGEGAERDPRRIWQTFAEHFHLFLGTPSGGWLRDELASLFGIEDKLCGASAQSIYDRIAARLGEPAFSPRRLYEQFRIEVLCTTDAATDDLQAHRAIRASGWSGRILPTFRPDLAVTIELPAWRGQVERLGELTGEPINDLAGLVRALEARRAYFRSLGATAADHAALTAHAGWLEKSAAETIFQRGLRGALQPGDAEQFMGHMLMEMARMSVDDGMVMQLHCGSYRNHNPELFARFGPDKGCDIPIAMEYTRSLRPLLAAFGNDPRLRLILFTLDEAAYGRELAPLAGHYPALRLGPPWWFFDSVNGMRRYFDQIMETAGLWNTCGFNDDTRAFPSIPVRHDVWRRAAADWVAGLLVRRQVDEDDARRMVRALAYDLAREAYRLDGGGAEPAAAV